MNLEKDYDSSEEFDSIFGLIKISRRREENGPVQKGRRKHTNMQLQSKMEITVSKEALEFLTRLETLVAGLDAVASSAKKKTPPKEKPASVADGLVENVDEDADEDFTPKTKKKAAPASKSFDDEEDEVPNDDVTEEQTEEGDGDFMEEKPKTKAKPKAPKVKKFTMADVNAACKARVTREMSDNELDSKEARDAVLSILKKKFKVKSVTDLEPEDYAAVVAEMEG